VNSGGQSGDSPEASATVPAPAPTLPAAPGSLTAIYSGGQVNLSWAVISAASSYDIYRGTVSGGESGTPLQTGVTATNFVDSAVTAGTKYFYEVTAVNASGQSSVSPEASATVPAAAPTPPATPAAPTTLTAIPSVGHIGLSWAAVSTASSYDVYRGTVSGGESVTPLQTGITATNFSDTTVSAGTKYFYEVTAVNSTGQSSVSPEASATVPTAAPSAPGSLTATPASGQVTLMWSAVSTATSYDIYRGTVSGGESATPFQVGITGTSFTDTSVTAGSSYFYEVTALNNGGQSGDSPEASATLTVPIPAMPAGVTATATSASTISVSWLDESYEAGFQVLESTDGVNYSVVTSTGTGVTSYLVSGLSAGTTYDFEIVATNASGNSAASSPASATTPSSTSGFYGLTATAQPSEILLAWPAQFGATSYNIFRGTSSGGESGTPIQSVLKGPFTDTTVSAGVTYYYTVEAVISGGQAELSSEVSATPLAPAPAAPTTLLASALPDGILLNWSAVSGATSYDIFRGLSSGNEAATPYEMGITTTSFVDTAVSGAGTYYYVVAGVNASGQGSASAEVSGSAPSVTGMPAPAGLFATANSTADITVSWQDVPGETGFEVLRSTDDVNFSQITTVGSGITNYADSGLNAGTTYYYEVVALNGGVASAASASTSATTQTAFDYTNEPAPEPSDGWTTSDPSNLITPTTTQPNNIFYVGMPVTFQLGNTAVSYQVRDYYGNLVDQGTAQSSTTVNVSKAGWYKLYVYGADTSAQFGNIIGTTTFVIFPNNPNSTPLTDLYQGNYYFIDPAMTRVDPTINFNWTNTAPTPSMPLTYYGVEWTGQIQAQATQTYVFSTTSDDGVRLWVNGQELINDWTPHGATNDFGSIALVAGQRYDIKVEYYQDMYAAQISLSWSSTTTPGQIIPASVLYPTDSSTTPSGLTGNYFIGLTSNDPSEDTVVHDVTGMGPERLNITNPSDPTTAIASVEADIATDDALYVGKDAERPTGLLVSFTNGTSDLTDIKTIVTALQGQVEYWEGQNEPDTGAFSGAGYVPVEEAFYNTVKSVNPNLQVLGPAAVSIADDGAGLPWIQDFLAAGGGQYINGLSFHGYDTNQGSLYQLREALTGITSLLAQYGLQNLPLWQTEQGYPTAIYGSYQPEIQGQWTMLQMMAYEQFGIPKEHNVLWYDDSDGYWDIPDFWQSDDGSLLPAAALMNSWSQQLYGTTYTEAYNFGSANNLYIGSLFTGPGKSVAAFMAAGQSNGSITLNVQGGTTLDVVDAFGNETAVPVVNGQVTLSVPEEPVYVDMTPGQTINVVQDSWGPDVALQSGTTASYSGSSASNSGISQIINGVQENWYWNGDAPWGTIDDTDQGANIQITLPQQETLSQVTIFAMPPWQYQGTLMDFDLQYFDSSNGQWETLDHVVQQADTFGVFTPVDRTTVDSYFDNQYIFQNAFSPVTTQQIRLVINSVSYGGGATQLVPESGGQASPTPTLTISEVELFG
jgi:fibronectin type 3 domain-containing protein